MQDSGTRLTLTVVQAARLLGIGRTQAYEAVRRRQLPALRLGKRILVPRAALERMLEQAAAPADAREAEAPEAGR